MPVTTMLMTSSLVRSLRSKSAAMQRLDPLVDAAQASSSSTVVAPRSARTGTKGDASCGGSAGPNALACDSGGVLTHAEARVLGSLIEKQLTTPDLYPLTLKALTTACNQTLEPGPGHGARRPTRSRPRCSC